MPPQARQSREYKVEPIFNPARTEANLNYLAEEGWRLVAIGDASNFRDEATGVLAKGPLLILERECFPEDEEEPGERTE